MKILIQLSLAAIVLLGAVSCASNPPNAGPDMSGYEKTSRMEQQEELERLHGSTMRQAY